MRKFLTSKVTTVVLTLAVLFGGVITATPAHAVAGTEVYLVQATPDYGWVKTTNINGWDKIIHEGETANNVAYACPPSDGWKMVVFGPNGTTRWMDPGECYTFTNPTNPGNPYGLSVVTVL